MSLQVVLRPLRHHLPWLFHFHHHPPTSAKALYHHHLHLHLLPNSSSSPLPEPTNTRRFSLAASRGSLRRTNIQKDEEQQQQEEQDPSIKSRNELKREAKRAVKWGMDLSSFNPPQIKRILRVFSLDQIVYEALMLVKRMGPDVREGRRRQFNYIGKLLRDVEPELMDRLIKAMNKANRFFSTASAHFESLLRKYSPSNSLSETKKLHALIITYGLLSSSQLCSKLATTYAQCHHVSYASQLFDKLPKRTLFSWNTMMRMYVQMGRPHDALNLFVEMFRLGRSLPDNFTYPIVIKACSELLFVDMGVGVHGQTLKFGFDLDTFVQNSLLAMYMIAGEKEAAQLVFDLMEEPTVVSWNTLINGYFRNNCAEEALRVYSRMTDEGVGPDCATVVSVLQACGVLKNVELGREVRALALEKGLWGNVVVRNALLDMYVKCGQMKEAQLLLNGMNEKDVVTWTTLINGYVVNGDARSALMLCRMMQLEGVKPNLVSVASLLSACGDLVSLKHGKCLHAWAIRKDLDSEVVVETALIDMYAKCNDCNLSYKVFMKTSKKRTAPWNAVLSGFVHNRLARNAIQLFKQMLVENVRPDSPTFNSLLPAYAILADLKQAMNIHCYLIRFGFLCKLEVASMLVDIYSKCGSLGYAHQIFDIIPPKDKDIIIWSAIIAAYGKHGHGEMAVSLFNQMVQSGEKPNEVTFTSVLHACSHAGLVDEGLSLFDFMLKKYQVIPRVDHYTCIVDLLGRAGRLNDAYNLIITMPIAHNHAVWGALLGACVIHENVELGEVAASWTFELEPENTGNYVLLAKLYASVGRWRDAENVRDMVNEVGLRKLPARSSVEVSNM